jgi:hypothetical protein
LVFAAHAAEYKPRRIAGFEGLEASHHIGQQHQGAPVAVFGFAKRSDAFVQVDIAPGQASSSPRRAPVFRAMMVRA